MKAIAMEYPEAWTAVSGSSAEAFEHDARMAAAVKLFEMGRLTSGQAAGLCTKAPPASMSSTSVTRMRMLHTNGRPAHWFGLIVMLSRPDAWPFDPSRWLSNRL